MACGCMGSDDTNLGDRHQPLSKVVAQPHVPSISGRYTSYGDFVSVSKMRCERTYITRAYHS